MAADAITSCGWRTAITAATSNPTRRAASNHRSDSAVIRGSLITTSGAAGSVDRYAVISAMQAARSAAPKAASCCSRSVGSYQLLSWRRRIVSLSMMAVRGSQ